MECKKGKGQIYSKGKIVINRAASIKDESESHKIGDLTNEGDNWIEVTVKLEESSHGHIFQHKYTVGMTYTSSKQNGNEYRIQSQTRRQVTTSECNHRNGKPSKKIHTWEH